MRPLVNEYVEPAGHDTEAAAGLTEPGKGGATTNDTARKTKIVAAERAARARKSRVDRALPHERKKEIVFWAWVRDGIRSRLQTRLSCQRPIVGELLSFRLVKTVNLSIVR